MCSVKEKTRTIFFALRTLLACAAILCSVGAQAMPITTQGTWTTTLLGRDQHGNPVDLLSGSNPNPELKYVYDTTLNLTWLANWNANGLMNWQAANTWATSLTDFGGGWRLPNVVDLDSPGCTQANSGTECGYNVYSSETDRRNSPLAHMYYDTLGNVGLFDAGNNLRPAGAINTGPFSNIMPALYWSGSAYPQSPSGLAWDFHMDWGLQLYGNVSASSYAVAVRDGDVFSGAVPEPQSFLLLGLAFATMVLVRRQRTH